MSLFIFQFCLKQKIQSEEKQEENEEEEEEEEFGHTDTYAEYVPSKCMSTFFYDSSTSLICFCNFSF